MKPTYTLLSVNAMDPREPSVKGIELPLKLPLWDDDEWELELWQEEHPKSAGPETEEELVDWLESLFGDADEADAVLVQYNEHGFVKVWDYHAHYRASRYGGGK